MKAKAFSVPGNYVQWANGFKSNMPDWPTARVVALVDEMLLVMKECRTVMLSMSTPANSVVERIIKSESVREMWAPRWDDALSRLQTVIGQADGLEAVVESFKEPLHGHIAPDTEPIQKPSFPKLPGVK